MFDEATGRSIGSRPWLVPIADTRVTAAYHDRSAGWADELGIASGHWEAREDLTTAADDFNWLTAELRIRRELAIHRLSRLTNLRLLDIIACTMTVPDAEQHRLE